MNTPKKKTPAIDLSKCVVGQRLRLRNGNESKLTFKGGQHLNYPYLTLDGQSHLPNGRVWVKSQDPLDIIEILPLPKKPAKPKPAESDVETLTSLFTEIVFKCDDDTLKKAIKALEGLV